jgi:DNA-binding transcriptional regulator PaaX
MLLRLYNDGMKTQGIDHKLQRCIRKHFAKQDWNDLANSLGITPKAVHYNLDAKLGRDVTYNFVGLVAVFYPIAWQVIMIDFINGGK